MVSVIRAFVNALRSSPTVPDKPEVAAQGSKESARTMTPIFVRQTGSSNIQPLIKVLEHAGHQAVVMQDGVNIGLPLGPGLPVLVFTELSPSKTQELEELHALHQQIPHAKIIALVDPAEPDAQAVQKCAEQPGVFRAFRDPFNAGGLLEVVDKLLPPASE